MLNMFQQAPHRMLPQASHDQGARQDFAKGLRGYIQREVLPGLTPLYRKVQSQAAREGVTDMDRHAIRKAMKKEPFFQSYAGANRTAQEMLWHAVLDSIEQDWDRMQAEADRLEGSIGSLKLNPDLEVPRYVTALDIHCMPGGYVGDSADASQLVAGALYDRGV